MLDRDLLQRTQVIVCHKNTEVACPDGVASAILLRDALPDAKVMFFSHDELRFALPRPGVLFCDICPGEEEAVEWAKHGAVVLDHHRSAEKVVRAFERSGHGVFADEREEPGVSGAVLAYREVWMPTVHPDGPPSSRRHMVVERFARLAGVRDTWQREDPEWRDACAQAEALQFWPWEEWPADAFHDDTMSGKLAGMLNLGYILLEKREQRTRQEAPHAGGEEALRRVDDGDERRRGARRRGRRPRRRVRLRRGPGSGGGRGRHRDETLPPLQRGLRLREVLPRPRRRRAHARRGVHRSRLREQPEPVRPDPHHGRGVGNRRARLNFAPL
jgi:hypothetical protein